MSNQLRQKKATDLSHIPIVNMITGGKGQSKIYFITWPVQNVTGQLLLLSISEVGQHFFEANINGAAAFLRAKL